MIIIHQKVIKKKDFFETFYVNIIQIYYYR